MKKKASMGFVYASPEMMLNSDHTTVNDERYPFFHAINYGEDAAGNEAEETDSYMNFAYASPQMHIVLENGNEYDLILMDIMMPNMSGDISLSKLKENPNFNIPTIALTADAVAGAKETYLSEGFVDYIAKPFSKAQIKEKLMLIFKK